MRASYVWAFLILAAIGGWIVSGDIIIGGQQDGGQPPAATGDTEPTGDALRNGSGLNDDAPFRVRVRTIEAEERERSLTLRGRTEADRRVTLRAQTGGLVEELAVAKGDFVTAGSLVCRIETGSREANVLKAEAALAQAELDHDAARQLSERGHAAETRVRGARAALDAASAALSDARLDLVRTAITAPFDGVIEALPAEVGALVNPGEVCAEIIARDPMLVIGQVSERDVGKLKPGMAGRARLVTGDDVTGTVRYIAPSADAATRTFRVELEVPNPDGRLREGVTAEVSLELEPVTAHRFSPAILTLNDAGQVGVRTVGEDNQAAFLPVEILADDRDSVWVSGLPEQVTVITVGQDYVEDGEPVVPVPETAEVAR